MNTASVKAAISGILALSAVEGRAVEGRELRSVQDLEQSKRIVLDELKSIELNAQSPEEAEGAKAFAKLFEKMILDPRLASSSAGKIAQIVAKGVLDREYSSVGDLMNALGDKFEVIVE